MKLVDHFDAFLTDTVNLNQTRIDTLTDRVAAISDALKTFDDFSELLIEAVPQGSWAHRTIIRPADTEAGFDADLVVFLDEHDEWQPTDYVENLYQRFREHGTYCNKVSRGTRCVTIQYAGEFYIDVVPCVRRTVLLIDKTEHVLNRLDNAEEETNPQGYTNWFQGRNSYLGSNQLVKVVRLLKYLRDIKQTFSAKSILLTTLVGQRIQLFDGVSSDFNDVPSSLRTLVSRLDKYLQENPTMPEVTNPSLPSEHFTRHWDQDKYSNFRECIHRYATWIDDAYLEKDRDESIEKWRRVFGNDFARGVTLAKAASMSEAASQDEASHVAPVPWPVMQIAKISIKATLHESKNGTYLGSYRSDGPALQKGTWLHLVSEHSFGSSILIRWQIVNTGWAARVARCLRGGFDHTAQDIWEHTEYKGKHWVECFAVDKSKGVCIARSGRFFVNIA